jgi:hypothetical protein
MNRQIVPWGRCVPNCLYLPYHEAFPCCSIRATTRAILDLVTPTCRAISASDNPNSSKPRLAIVARRALTFFRRLPPLTSCELISTLAHSSLMILAMVLPVRRSLSWLRFFSSASLKMALTKSPPPSYTFVKFLPLRPSALPKRPGTSHLYF